MKRAIAGRRRMAGYAAAAIVGFALGSWQYLKPASGGGSEEGHGSTPGTLGASPAQSPAVSVSPGDRDDAQESSTRTRDTGPGPRDANDMDSLVFASQGVLLRPAVTDGRFIGFLVVRNGGDRRFSVGDIIVSVNDRPVENSAAGSELLVAGLADPDVPVGIHSGRTE